MIHHDTTGILTHLLFRCNGIAHSALRTDSAKHRMASRGALDKFEESSFIEVWVPGQSERVDPILPSNRLISRPESNCDFGSGFANGVLPW